MKNLNSLLTAPEQLETKRDKLIARRDAAAEKANEAIKKQARTGAGEDKYKPLAEKYTKLDEQVKAVEREIVKREGKKRRIGEFVAALETGGTEYSDELWCTMVEKVTVYSGWFVFKLVTGQEVRVERA